MDGWVGHNCDTGRLVNNLNNLNDSLQINTLFTGKCCRLAENVVREGNFNYTSLHT